MYVTYSKNCALPEHVGETHLMFVGIVLRCTVEAALSF
jgi:hypothetical protein